ncbi:MAG: alpha-ketoglutarate-dependent dioxygenase AlkB [Rhodomicrobium sp.]
MTMPEGFRYQPAVISEQEENELLPKIGGLDFKPFDFHGFLGNRRVISFGWRYDFSDSKLKKADPIPPFLFPVRDLAARFADVDPSTIGHVLVTEYAPGAAIGWHRDRFIFGDVIGVSLHSECTFRMRHKTGTKWDRASMVLEPRSAYVMRGTARTVWEHSIPAVEQLRYSITFRTMMKEEGER